MIYDLVDGRRGHFLLESGLHSELWLDLDPLFADQARVAPFVSALASQLRAHEVDVVCGALVGGAFLAQLLAQALDVEFSYTSKLVVPSEARDLLFQARYELPAGFHSRVKDKRVAIVDDVMSAGSALRGTYAELRTHGAKVVVAGALLVLGEKGTDYFAAEGVPVVFSERDEFATWAPAECPLCATRIPLT
ncbi:MAG: phosphoribosyltransferase [Gemmatimonadetes bacterium]|nr:phosphoribosyltransferase [Gemmatimonadota bacterium]